jgi:hypothetical protein
VDSYLTHFLVGYNFSPRFGVNLNVPWRILEFRRKDVRYSLTSPPVNYTEVGTETGLGDVSLIGRAAVFQKMDMDYGVVVNVLGGVKFRREMMSAWKKKSSKRKSSTISCRREHRMIRWAIPRVPSTSICWRWARVRSTGIFGVTASFNWKRLFANAQFQYYLRTEADSGSSLGTKRSCPAGRAFLFSWTSPLPSAFRHSPLTMICSATELLGTVSVRTGMTAWLYRATGKSYRGRPFQRQYRRGFPLKIENGFLSSRSQLPVAWRHFLAVLISFFWADNLLVFDDHIRADQVHRQNLRRIRPSASDRTVSLCSAARWQFFVARFTFAPASSANDVPNAAVDCTNTGGGFVLVAVKRSSCDYLPFHCSRCCPPPNATHAVRR